MVRDKNGYVRVITSVGVRYREAWSRFWLSIESFCGANFYGEEILVLATNFNGASVYAISDIGDVDETLLDGEKTETLIYIAAKIVGVYDMEKYYASIFCKKGTAGESVGKCDNCKAIQAICKENEKITGKLFLQCNGEKVSVRVNDKMLEKISESKGLDATTLLFARPFDVKKFMTTSSLCHTKDNRACK